MPVRQLKEYLDAHGVRYATISHPTVYTAQEIAAASHVPGKELAKTVIVKLDGKMAMAVLPASDKVDFDLLRQETKSTEAHLATESEFKDAFPGCNVGAMPPFGNLYGLDVYVAAKLAEDEEVAFNAGSHTELVRMAYCDFERLVKPKVIRLSREPVSEPR